MKNIFIIGLVSFLMVACKQDAGNTTGAGAEKEIKLDSLEKKISYIFGNETAKNLKTMDYTLDPEVVALAVQHVNEDTDPLLSDEEVRATMVAFQTEQQAKRQERENAIAKDNLGAGKKFLEDNAKKDGVKTLESGLQYKVLKEGKGAIPKATDTVIAHYEGRLLSGKVFDSSLEGEPAEFPVSALIPGWVEALQLMKEGSKWELYIPGDLAYGVGGKMNYQSGQYDIEPNSTLIFQLELIEIKKPEEVATE